MVQLMILLITSLFASDDVGFSRGNDFYENTLEGNLQVNCSTPQGLFRGFAHCVGTQIFPVDHDYFVGPNIDADKVQLVRVMGGGEIVSKTKGYSNGRSTQPFNLFIATVFQKPLLSRGDNLVTYRLTRGEEIVDEGEFIARVLAGQRRYCAPYFYNSMNKMDCDTPWMLCQQYFAVAANTCR